jgi:glycosyltransferase involved in cell wall biosynthesis
MSFRVGRLQAFGYALPRVTAIVAVCESIKRGLVAAGVPPAKIEVIYPGTDPERFHPGGDRSAIRKELGLGPENLLITQVGVRSTKGNDDVIDAMEIVARRAPHARLLIVGARDARPLLQRARARGIEHALSVFGYRDDIPAILAASHCCVDASHTGLGLTGSLREALSVETPVVATDLEGNRELIRHGVSGLLVRPRDVAGLAEAILRLVVDREAAVAIGRAGRQLVVRWFSTRTKVERTEALYRRLLAGDATRATSSPEESRAGPPGQTRLVGVSSVTSSGFAPTRNIPVISGWGGTFSASTTRSTSYSPGS